MRAVIVLLIIFLSCGQPSESNNIDYELIQDPKILAHEVDLKTSQLAFYYKDESQGPICRVKIGFRKMGILG